MNSIIEHTCKDIALIIFEFLIDDDYTPFRIKDIKLLKKKIRNWEVCMFEASSRGDFEFFKYSENKIFDDVPKKLYTVDPFGTSSIRKRDEIKYGIVIYMGFMMDMQGEIAQGSLKDAYGLSYIYDLVNNNLSFSSLSNLSENFVNFPKLISDISPRALKSLLESNTLAKCMCIASSKGHSEIVSYIMTKLNHLIIATNEYPYFSMIFRSLKYPRPDYYFPITSLVLDQIHRVGHWRRLTFEYDIKHIMYNCTNLQMIKEIDYTQHHLNTVFSYVMTIYQY